MGDSVSFGTRLDNALAASSPGGARITRAEYQQLRDNLPLGSSSSTVRGLREWGLSEASDKLWAAVAGNDSYESFLQNYQRGGTAPGGGGGHMKTWENK